MNLALIFLQKEFEIIKITDHKDSSKLIDVHRGKFVHIVNRHSCKSLFKWINEISPILISSVRINSVYLKKRTKGSCFDRWSKSWGIHALTLLVFRSSKH